MFDDLVEEVRTCLFENDAPHLSASGVAQKAGADSDHIHRFVSKGGAKSKVLDQAAARADAAGAAHQQAAKTWSTSSHPEKEKYVASHGQSASKFTKRATVYRSHPSYPKT